MSTMVMSVGSLNDLFRNVDISATPNYKALLMMRNALLAYFEPEMANKILGQMTIEVTQSAMDVPNFPDLIKSMAHATHRVYEQMKTDMGESDDIFVSFCKNFSLEFTEG